MQSSSQKTNYTKLTIKYLEIFTYTNQTIYSLINVVLMLIFPSVQCSI